MPAETQTRATQTRACREPSYSHTVHPRDRSDVIYHVFHRCVRGPAHDGNPHRCTCGETWMESLPGPDPT